MSQKTYLAPAEQWERTVAFFLKHNDHPMHYGYADSGVPWDKRPPGAWGLGHRRYDEKKRKYLDHWDDWYLGQIVYPHRLFVPGDLAIIMIMHGAMRRQTCWCISSKGYQVKRYYALMDTCYEDKEAPRWSSTHIPRRKRDAFYRGEKIVQGGWYAPHGDYHNVDRGPLRYVKHPRDLTGLPPDHAAVRRYAVETLRAGDAATRVSADSPHLLLQARGRR